MEYIGDSRTGLKRTVNEDRIIYLVSGEVGLFAVADGMGGHTDGDKASEAIAEALEAWWHLSEKDRESGDFLNLKSSLTSCIESVNQFIYRTYNQGTVCGATLSILLIQGNYYAIFHVGDSRVYALEKRKLSQLTTDEVWENDMRTKKRYTLKEIRQSDKRGKLINAIGTVAETMLTIKTDELRGDTLFLLCSDGCYKMMRPHDLIKTLRKVAKGATLDWGIETLMDKVYEAGAKDNVSILLIKTSRSQSGYSDI